MHAMVDELFGTNAIMTRRRIAMILILIVIIYLVGGFSGRIGGYGYGMGHSGMGLGVVILVVLIILVWLHKL